MLGNTVAIDFGTFVLPAAILSSTNVQVTPAGVVTPGGTYTQHTGGSAGSFTLNASDSGIYDVYAAAANTSISGLALLGCGGGVLSTATINGVALDSTGPKKTPGAKFSYGATLTFSQLISGGSTMNCTASNCTTSGAFYYNLGAPATTANKDGDVQFCFVVRFRSAQIALTHRTNAKIDFGRVCSPLSAGTGYVTVSPAGVRSASGVECALNAVSADIFDVSGAASSAYTVKLPASATLTNGASVLTVDTFSSACTGGSCVLSSSGTGSFTVGARLAVPYGVTPGIYNGSYTVSVIY